MSTAFNLEAAIAAWRRPLEHMRAVAPDDLRELESTLRDAIDDHRAAGASTETAFRRAVRDLDDPFVIEREYQKVFWKKSVHRHTFTTEIGHAMSMLRSHITTALRTMRRQKGYAFINIGGLAFGLAACLLLVLFVREELSFDRFHEKGDRIYRVVLHAERGSIAQQSALLAPLLQTELPGVEATVRFLPTDEIAIGEPGEQVRTATGFLYTDASFFDVFTFPLILGDPGSALAEPWSVVLTERAAETWFPNQNPVGQTLPIQGADPFVVTGVVDTPPAESSIQFDFLGSMATLAAHPAERGMFESGWGAFGYPTYVLVDASTPASRVEERIKPLILTQMDGPIREARFALEPLREHHFSPVSGALATTSDIRFLYVFSSIAALILLIACINFINLATARATLRAREVGIRKAVGADRGALIRQFMAESMLTTLFALGLALLLVAATVGPFAALVERSLSFGDLLDGPVLAALAAIVLLVGLGAGSWPAFVLARFQPSRVLKGESGGSSSGLSIRRGMVVVQFAISIVLLVGTITIQRQLLFIQEKDLGFDEERVVTVRLGGEVANQAEILAETYRGLPGVGGATLSGAIPSQTSNARFGFKVDVVEHYATVYPVDAVFAETMGMDIVAGRNFNPEINDASNRTREGGAIINESMARLLDAEDPIGALLPVRPNLNSYRVVGVVRDFHMTTLQHEITPVLLLPREDFWTRYVSVRLDTEDYAGVLAAMEAEWTRIDPTRPFNYRFLDEALDQLYKGPYQLARLFNAFSLTAVLIACLGLFGLAAFTTVRRTREIGIRKALGASQRSILVLLTREFLLLVAVAFVLAAPMAWFASNRWLETFAYRVDVGWITFLVGGVLMAVIAVGTVAWQAVRAASTNPTEALRHV